MKPLKQCLFLFVVMTTCIYSPAQENDTKKSSDQKQERQVWIRLKSGPVLSGNLVKMDSESVDFTVKGVLQSVKCDELIGVMFIPPTPRPTPTPTPSPQTPVQAPVPSPEKTQVAQATEQTAPVPDRCNPIQDRKITLAGGQYKPLNFGNTKRDFRYYGSFTVHGGKISVYIVDSENYANLLNRKKFYAFYSATKVAEGNFDLNLKMGMYHLVWWNESPYDTRVVENNLCFSHPTQ